MGNFNFIEINDNNHYIYLPKRIGMCSILTPSELKDMYRDLIIDYIDKCCICVKEEQKDRIYINLGEDEINSYRHSIYEENEDDIFPYIINEKESIYALNIPIKIYGRAYGSYGKYEIQGDSDLTLFFENMGRFLRLKLINFRIEYPTNYDTLFYSYNLIVI